MRQAFKRAFKIFAYLSLLFTIVYWIYVVIEDYSFIEKYWITHWLDYLGIWTIYFLIYYAGFTFYFWLISTFAILTYFKVRKTDS